MQKRQRELPHYFELVAAALILAAGCVWPFAAWGQENGKEIPPGLVARTETFFRALSDTTAEPERAFRELLASGPLASRTNEVKKLAERYRKLQQQHGSFVQAERISAKVIGSDVVNLRYLHKAEKSPVAWYFTYYRPPGATGQIQEWVVISLRFDTRIDELVP